MNRNEKKKTLLFQHERLGPWSKRSATSAIGVPESSWDQKSRDMHAYDVDVFAMGDDWAGRFDFLKEEGVDVVYLPRNARDIHDADKNGHVKGERKVSPVEDFPVDVVVTCC